MLQCREWLRPCPARSRWWQKLCHGGRAFPCRLRTTAALTQRDSLPQRHCQPREQEAGTGRARKAAFIGYPEKPTPGLAKSTASLGRRRRSPEDLLLTRFSSAGGYQPAKCHALAKVLLPHHGTDAGGRPPARSKRKGGRGSPGAPGHLLASPGSFPGSIRDTGTHQAKALPPPQGQVGFCPVCQQPVRCGDQAGASGSPSTHHWVS